MPPRLESHIFGELQGHVGPDLEILTDKHDARFHEYSKRWSDIDRKVPAAIVLPQTEEQIQSTVRWAVQHSVPFVVKSGGHSTWSTIGEEGFIIDLSNYSGITVDSSGPVAKLRGSILSKAVAVHLAGNGYFAGRGCPIFPKRRGLNHHFPHRFGSDQIVAARMIDAQGDLVEVTQERQPDLLYAIRGAGQFFGLITELTIKIWPLSELGNDNGVIWSGRFVFPMEMAPEVAQAMKYIVEDGTKATAGLLMTVCPPPARRPALAVAARYIGNPDDATAAFSALYELKPIIADGGPVPIQNVSDGREALEAKGGFKTFGTVGLRRFDIERFLATIEVWKRLMAECPDAINTTFNFQWDSRPPRQPPFESANSLHDIRFWQNNIIWYTNASSHQKVAQLNAECIAIARGPDRFEYADFQNATRTGPIELRFRGKGKLEKLRSVKRKWDPEGVFTAQFLN